MGIFDFRFDDGNDGRVRLSKHGWIFPAIAAPLTLMTLSLSWLYLHIGTRKREREQEAFLKSQANISDAESSLAEDGSPEEAGMSGLTRLLHAHRCLQREQQSAEPDSALTVDNAVSSQASEVLVSSL